MGPLIPIEHACSIVLADPLGRCNVDTARHAADNGQQICDVIRLPDPKFNHKPEELTSTCFFRLCVLAGEMVFVCGQASDCMYFILSGTVEIIDKHGAQHTRLLCDMFSCV